MKVAVIGAGPSGLVSIKYCIENGFECDGFEQTSGVGGTWIYTDKTGVDENGITIHSSMYQGLRTNLPKEVMAYADFPYPEQKKSFISQDEVTAYFRNYANHFQLKPHIKFLTQVIEVKPTNTNKWSLKIMNVKTKSEDTAEYDAVMICNGHYSDPAMPDIPGKEQFKGSQIHSHSYRKREAYKNKRVLIIGAGPSGCDISAQIAEVADTVYLSHRVNNYYNPISKMSENIIKKPPVKKLNTHGCVFDDDTKATFDDIIYCTGYRYSYPFLSEECGITVTNNWVRPLYKHVINIEHPTMGFVGIPFKVSVVPMFDIQARFFLSCLKNNFQYLSKQVMLSDLEKDTAERKKKGLKGKGFHEVGDGADQETYFQDLASTGKIKPLPTVISKVYQNVREQWNHDLCYKIVNDENYVLLS